jgi:hypothetical protein
MSIESTMHVDVFCPVIYLPKYGSPSTKTRCSNEQQTTVLLTHYGGTATVYVKCWINEDKIKLCNITSIALPPKLFYSSSDIAQ